MFNKELGKLRGMKYHSKSKSQRSRCFEVFPSHLVQFEGKRVPKKSGFGISNYIISIRFGYQIYQVLIHFSGGDWR